MIIRSLKATNLLKYRTLALNDLPAKALIAITGVNESGKTGLVETICLALFGRTFYLEPDNLTKGILWGETHGEVEMVFTGNTGRDYRITRTIDSEGRQSARLTTDGSDDALAKGPSAVLARVVELVGFDYREFIESIYLAQKGTVTSSHPSAATASAVSGVQKLNQVERTLGEEILTLKAAIGEHEQQLDELQGQYRRLAFDPNQLPNLEQEQEASRALASESADAAREWEEVIAEINQHLGSLHALRGQLAALSGESPVGEWRVAHSALATTLDQLAESLPEDEESAEGESAARVLESARATQAEFDQRMAGLDALLALVDAQGAEADAALADEGEAALAVQMAELQAEQRRAGASRGRRGLLFWLCLPPAALLLGAWYLIAHLPQSATAVSLIEIIGARFPQWQSVSHTPWLLYTGGALAVVALFAFFAMLGAGSTRGGAERRLAALQGEAADMQAYRERLQGFAALSVPQLLDTLEARQQAALSAQLATFREGAGALFVDVEALAAWHAQSDQQMGLTEDAVRAELEACHQELTTQQGEHDRYQSRIGELEGAILREQERVRQAQELNLVRADMEANRDQTQRQIRVREEASLLLRGASRQAMEQFNRDLKIFMSRVMPQLTEDRYHYLILDPSLDVEVFSRDKHDFIGWDEISTGTQQQILLALRLALSAALAEGAAGGQGQTIMLDEPFAFYDAKRIADALNALPKVSERLTQIWVISQEFADMRPFDLHIDCQRGQDVLVVNGG